MIHLTTTIRVCLPFISIGMPIFRAMNESLFHNDILFPLVIFEISDIGAMRQIILNLLNLVPLFLVAFLSFQIYHKMRTGSTLHTWNERKTEFIQYWNNVNTELMSRLAKWNNVSKYAQMKSNVIFVHEQKDVELTPCYCNTDISKLIQTFLLHPRIRRNLIMKVTSKKIQIYVVRLLYSRLIEKLIGPAALVDYLALEDLVENLPKQNFSLLNLQFQTKPAMLHIPARFLAFNRHTIQGEGTTFGIWIHNRTPMSYS